MKKYLNIAFAYLLAGLAGGVFFREFTKFNAFTGVTALGFLHVHLLVLENRPRQGKFAKRVPVKQIRPQPGVAAESNSR